MAWPMRAGIHVSCRAMEGGKPSIYSETISLISLATDLLPFVAVASREPAYYSKGIIIYTIGEWYTNGMAVESRHPSFHAAQ